MCRDLWVKACNLKIIRISAQNINRIFLLKLNILWIHIIFQSEFGLKRLSFETCLKTFISIGKYRRKAFQLNCIFSSFLINYYWKYRTEDILLFLVHIKFRVLFEVKLMKNFKSPLSPEFSCFSVVYFTIITLLKKMSFVPDFNIRKHFV